MTETQSNIAAPSNAKNEAELSSIQADLLRRYPVRDYELEPQFEIISQDEQTLFCQFTLRLLLRRAYHPNVRVVAKACVPKRINLQRYEQDFALAQQAALRELAGSLGIGVVGRDGFAGSEMPRSPLVRDDIDSGVPVIHYLLSKAEMKELDLIIMEAASSRDWDLGREKINIRFDDEKRPHALNHFNAERRRLGG